MFIQADTLDDLLRKTLPQLLSSDTHIKSEKGDNREVSGVLLKLTNPLARISRTEGKGTLFSCLGELLWYLSGTNRLDHIQYYIKIYDQFSDDKKTIHGAYGPRLFGIKNDAQILHVIERLQRKPQTRKAVIQIFSSTDILEDHLDIPCTCTLQFLVRNERLSLYTSMRSNDAFKGLPHDIFAFTMIQEMIARHLNFELGEYSHYASSLHIYDEDESKIKSFLSEGWQDQINMPAMPNNSPQEDILKLLKHERLVRKGNSEITPPTFSSTYWSDLAIVLNFYKAIKQNKSIEHLESIVPQITNEEFQLYLRKKIHSIKTQGIKSVSLYQEA